MEIEFTYKEIHKISTLLFLKMRLKNDSKICHFYVEMNMLNIYRQSVDYGLLPFVINNLGNLGSAKQRRHKLAFSTFSPTSSF